MASRGTSDDDLRELLGQVQLTHILDRECGWDATADWMDVLSGGEKQRIAVCVSICCLWCWGERKVRVPDLYFCFLLSLRLLFFHWNTKMMISLVGILPWMV